MHLQYTQTMKNKFMLKHDKTTPLLLLFQHYNVKDITNNLDSEIEDWINYQLNDQYLQHPF